MKIHLRIITSFFCALMFTSAPQATTLARLSLDQLAASSNSVARVRCIGTRSGWDDGSIWTINSFKVLETFKGNLPVEIEVRLPGGRAGHLTATIDGTPKFSPGDEVILFLDKSRTGGFSVAGWVEGTFRISRDAASGKETVTQDSSAFAVFDPATRTFRAQGVRRMPSEIFRTRLLAAIARSGGVAALQGKESNP